MIKNRKPKSYIGVFHLRSFLQKFILKCTCQLRVLHISMGNVEFDECLSYRKVQYIVKNS